MPKGPTFEERYAEIVVLIDKRRTKWQLASIPFEDVRQMVLVKISAQYSKFDETKGRPEAPLEERFARWANKLITNELLNILRDHHFIYSRPCITGCAFNTGGDTCSKTTSGLQCDECPIYKEWRNRKEAHFNVKQTLPLDNHFNEADSMVGDFLDVGRAKDIIDAEMKKRLNRHEYRVYKLLYLQNKTPAEVGKILKYKKVGKCHHGYQVLLQLRKKFVLIARQIIDDENLV